MNEVGELDILGEGRGALLTVGARDFTAGGSIDDGTALGMAVTT
jgi:hypothetical protein